MWHILSEGCHQLLLTIVFEYQVPHLYCIGDANGKMMLAHAASAQGISGTYHVPHFSYCIAVQIFFYSHLILGIDLLMQWLNKLLEEIMYSII